MKILVLLLSLSPLALMGQTFNSTYQMSTNTRNILTDMTVHGNDLHLTMAHVCDPDSNDNQVIQCLGYAKLNIAGELEAHILYDTFFAANGQVLANIDDEILIGASAHGNSSHGRPLSILNVNTQQQVKVQTTTDSSLALISGLDNFGQSLYISGPQRNLDLNQTSAAIHKLGMDYQPIWSFIHARGVNNSCYSFQPTSDGKLIFLNEYHDGAGAQSNGGVEIVKLDTNGQLVDTLAMPAFHQNGKPRMLAASDGSIYIASQDIIIPGVWPSSFSGTINKLSADFDSILWSVPLPDRPWYNDRNYTIRNFLEAANGDIIAVGDAWDAGIDGPHESAHLINNNGFAARVSAETGELIWLRVYQLPIENDLLDPLEDGAYISSELLKIHELPDGHFIVGGTAYYDGPQQAVLQPAGETVSYVWLMNIDENGCLDGEECSENIILDGVYRPTDGFLPVISDEHTWTYGFFFGFGSYSLHETWSTDTIWDDGWYYERYQSLNEDGSEATVEGLYVETNGRLMQKNGSGFFDRKVVFDITVLAGDTILLDIEDWPAELYVESTDTVVFADGVPRKRVVLRCVDYPFDYQERIWIEGLGDLSSGHAACILDSGKELICYSDEEGIIYKADWPDECWLTTSTDDLDTQQLILYPNPVAEVLHVEVESKALQTYIINTISGQETMAGILPSNGIVDVSNLPPGIYILQVRDDLGKRSVSKFVKE